MKKLIRNTYRCNHCQKTVVLAETRKWFACHCSASNSYPPCRMILVKKPTNKPTL